MTKLKALCRAGLAGVLASAGLATSAGAADLLLPPPPPVVPLPVPVPIAGGFYLRGDVGVGINDLRTRNSTFDESVPDAHFEQSAIDDSPIIDVGVGYRFSNYFRADVTGEYRGSASFTANQSYNVGAFAYDQYGNPPPNGARAYDFYSAHVRSVLGLVNGYVDVGTWYGVTPFVGAGVGVANVAVKNLTDISYGSGAAGGAGNGGGGFAPDHDQTNFAFALMAGLDFAVTPNVALELGYRYLNQGDVSSSPIRCVSAPSCPNEVQHYRLQSNDIRLGFRYTFLAAVPVAAPVIARY